MPVDLTDAVPFLSWFPWALADWLLAVFVISLVVTVIGWLIAAIRHGPIQAFAVTGKVWSTGVSDLVSISPRRVMALSWLAIKESIRRRVVVVFAIFILVLLYAGWFLDPKSTNPALLYLSFVLTATSYLVLIMVLFLQRTEPAGGHQKPHVAHDRHQAGSDERNCAGPDFWFCGNRDFFPGRNGADQLRIRSSRPGPHARIDRRKSEPG